MRGAHTVGPKFQEAKSRRKRGLGPKGSDAAALIHAPVNKYRYKYVY